MAKILIPLPQAGFDPTETAIPWAILTQHGHTILFATPTAQPAQADPRMVTGQDLGPLAAILRADRNARAAYATMQAAPEFQAPLPYAALPETTFDALLLPGGHAKQMRPYLESPLLQALTASSLAHGKIVAAICHGVVLAARARAPSGHSALYGRKTTALLESQERLAHTLTRLWLADYYRTYPQPVEAEVTAALATPSDFLRGPTPLTRDTPENPHGFVVQDANYLSARWPGDAHAFANAVAAALAAASANPPPRKSAG